MPTASISYGTTTAITITLASLASDTALVAGRASTSVDNGTRLAVDYLVGGKVTTTSGTASRQVEVWLYGMYDDVEYSGSATGSDANLTPDEKTNLKLLQVIPTVAAPKTYKWGPQSVAMAFGGVVPEKWGAYVVHNTGANLNATGANHEIVYTAVNYTSA